VINLGNTGLAHTFDDALTLSQLIGKSCDYFILHVEEIGHCLLEAIRPKMVAVRGVRKLHVDPYTITTALDAPF
jgi:hypothetical protein